MKKWIKTMSASLIVCLALAPSVQAKNARADLKTESVKANVTTNVTFPLVLETSMTIFTDGKKVDTLPENMTFTYASATKCKITTDKQAKDNDTAKMSEAEIKKRCDEFFNMIPKNKLIELLKKSKIPFKQVKQTIAVKMTPKQMVTMTLNDLSKEEQKNKKTVEEMATMTYDMYESIEITSEYNDKNNIIKQTVIMTLSNDMYEKMKKADSKNTFKQMKAVVNLTYNPKKKTK